MYVLMEHNDKLVYQQIQGNVYKNTQLQLQVFNTSIDIAWRSTKKYDE